MFNLFRNKSRGATAKAQFMELVNDEFGLLAALIGTLFVLWGQPLADPIAALIVATMIAVNAVGLLLENLSFLLGRSPGREYLAEIERLAKTVPGVLGVHDLRAEYIGPNLIHAGMHIEVQRCLPIEEAERISEAVHHPLHQETSSGYCVIHVDAAQPSVDAKS